MIYIIFGVSGSGKSSVGNAFSDALSLPFFDADDYHPKANIKKMAKGIPLDDKDRSGWLMTLSALLFSLEKEGKSAVLACSALKEVYRKQLSKNIKQVKWILLHGKSNTLLQRIKNREQHFFKPSLLQSQLDILEIPDYALLVDIENSVPQIVDFLLDQLQPTNVSFGIIGLGVMGKSIARNAASKDFPTAVYNREVKGVEENIAHDFAAQHQFLPLQAFDDLEKFVHYLVPPRTILLMLPAGAATEQVLHSLSPLLNAGDTVMDGGNAHYSMTHSRANHFSKAKINYIGLGISGGEEGALKGPSLMPGGPKPAVNKVLPLLQALAAKDQHGMPCCAYIGPEGSGHFVKMMHNGIEYAEMQLIAELYQLMLQHNQMEPEAISQCFSSWSKNGSKSFLLDISTDILLKKEGGEYLLEQVLDVAGQKGTGGWCVEAAFALDIPLNTISAAVMARAISGQKKSRIKIHQQYSSQIFKPASLLENILQEALQCASLLNHIIGFEALRAASEQYQWQLSLSEIARIWTNGCILKSELMEQLQRIFKENTEGTVLLIPEIQILLQKKCGALTTLTQQAMQAGCAIPVFSAALNYFHGMSTAESSASMIQAQRDYFGAHTYQKKGVNGNQYFHSNWK